MIMAATGGDFLFDILPHLNPSIIQENIKWIMGASDPTGLVYPITTKYDIATLYGEMPVIITQYLLQIIWKEI